MTTDRRRSLIGRLLLALYLTILAVGAFHVHEHVEDFVCQDCISHVRHGGHITDGSVSLGDCVLCSFLSISYLLAEVTALATFALVLHRVFAEQTAYVVCRTRRTILLRGPPVCL